MKTPLEILQQEIDQCNQRHGCDSRCSKRQQKQCEKLRAHAERMEYCRKNNLPIQYW